LIPPPAPDLPTSGSSMAYYTVGREEFFLVLPGH
jgi:hypothetical protein